MIKDENEPRLCWLETPPLKLDGSTNIRIGVTAGMRGALNEQRSPFLNPANLRNWI